MGEPRSRGPILRPRLLLACVAAFLLLGMFLPATIPGQGSGEPRPSVFTYDVCTALFWIDTLFLPASVPDWIGITVNLLTCVLWGVVVGLLACWLHRW